MHNTSVSRPRIHFTKEHQWIDFNGTVAFIGVSKFRLTGIRHIDSIRWMSAKGTLEKGTLIAHICSGDDVIPVHAPLHCKFLGPNAKLSNNPNLILESPQDQGWLFFVTPLKFQPKDKEELLQPEAYKKLLHSIHSS